MLPGNSHKSTSGDLVSSEMKTLSLSRLAHPIFAKQYVYDVLRGDFQAEN